MAFSWQPRRGISLLEVLFSVFVLTTGILGFSLLIPIGKFHAAQSNHMDRAVSVGEAAFREIETRGMLAPGLWRYYNKGYKPYILNVYADDANRGNPVLIDPLLVAYQGNSNNAASFPYGPNGDMVKNSLRMPRLSVAGLTSVALAERACVWRDDLVAEVPENDPDGRPVLMSVNGSTVHNFTGDYTWAAMVTPVASENEQAARGIYQPNDPHNHPFHNYIPYSQRRLYKVSVIVYYKRNVKSIQRLGGVPSPERQVRVTRVMGNGLLLSTRNQQVGTLKANQWIMLSGVARRGRAPFHAWYRIVSVGTVRNSVDNVYVTLAGPDFPLALVTGTPVATICDGVVGVFERTMKLNFQSATSY